MYVIEFSCVHKLVFFSSDFCLLVVDFKNVDAGDNDADSKLRVTADLQYTSPLGQTLLNPKLDGDLVCSCRGVIRFVPSVISHLSAAAMCRRSRPCRRAAISFGPKRRA